MIRSQKSFFLYFIISILLSCFINTDAQVNTLPVVKVDSLRHKIHYIIIIYQENWSFDGLYGKFPGCNNLDSAKNIIQIDKKGQVIDFLPFPIRKTGSNIRQETKFSKLLPAQPYDLSKFVRSNDKTGDLVHRFYTEQLQIDGGKMDKFVTWSDNGGTYT